MRGCARNKGGNRARIWLAGTGLALFAAAFSPAAWAEPAPGEAAAAPQGVAPTAMTAPVATQAGLVQGRVEGEISVFRGIPFAAPPVGDLRWKAPQPSAKWAGVRAATAFAPACPQLPFGGPVFPVLPTSEDCLYLNVWAPAQHAAPAAPLPVMVWIYGGSFTGGATGFPLYSGEALASKGVIVVSLAYRVGALGFLAHPELSSESPAKASGNYGLMDLVAGLQWVHNNIAQFGGDPGRVTLFGESAGATAVSMLVASPKTRGLIQGAISESGGAFAPARHAMEGGQTTPLLATAEARGVALLGKLGVGSIAEARRVPADEIVRAAGATPTVFWPVLDGDVLPDDLYRLYQARKYNDVPVIAGFNSDEGAMFVPPLTADEFGKSLAAYGDYAGPLAQAYPARTDAQAVDSARALFSDTIFRWPTWTWARLQTQTGGKPVYLYRFGRVAGPPPFPVYQPKGALHGAEIAYVFGHPMPDWKDADHALSQTMMSYWVNFAKTGNPNGAGIPKWPAFNVKTNPVMDVNSSVAVGEMDGVDRLNVLEKYFSFRRKGK